MQIQAVASAAWVMETRSRKERWEGSMLIYAEQNSSYGRDFYGIYIVLRFILQMRDESNNKQGKSRIRCNKLAEMLDSNQSELKTKRSKTFGAILGAIKKRLNNIGKRSNYQSITYQRTSE